MPPELIDTMSDAAGSSAMDAYEIALADGASPADAMSSACEAAGTVMADMGCEPAMIDTMVTAASDSFTEVMDANPGMDPMDAFDAAGEGVDTAMTAEYGPMDGPPTGMDAPTPMEGMDPPPGMDGDMAPPDPTGELAGSENIAPTPGMDGDMPQPGMDDAPGTGADYAGDPAMGPGGTAAGADGYDPAPPGGDMAPPYDPMTPGMDSAPGTGDDYAGDPAMGPGGTAAGADDMGAAESYMSDASAATGAEGYDPAAAPDTAAMPTGAEGAEADTTAPDTAAPTDDVV